MLPDDDRSKRVRRRPRGLSTSDGRLACRVVQRSRELAELRSQRIGDSFETVSGENGRLELEDELLEISHTSGASIRDGRDSSDSQSVGRRDRRVNCRRLT
jgi:hypothetical protein